MSHVVSIAIEFQDLDAIKAACRRLGWTFREGQGTYRWFGHWVDDSPVPRHLFAEEAEYNRVVAMSRDARRLYMDQLLGHCEHAISVPGCDYEIGIQNVGGKWVPVWDWFHAGGLHTVMGTNGGPLAQAYAVEKSKLEACRRGYPCTETATEDRTIFLDIVESY